MHSKNKFFLSPNVAEICCYQQVSSHIFNCRSHTTCTSHSFEVLRTAVRYIYLSSLFPPSDKTLRFMIHTPKYYICSLHTRNLSDGVTYPTASYSCAVSCDRCCWLAARNPPRSITSHTLRPDRTHTHIANNTTASPSTLQFAPPPDLPSP